MSNPVAPIPPELVEALTAAPARQPLPVADGYKPGDGYGAAALAGEVARVRAAANGQRNHTLNRAAFALGQIVGAGALDRVTVEYELTAAAMAVGLGKLETEKTIKSGLEDGESQPRVIPDPKADAADVPPDDPYNEMLAGMTTEATPAPADTTTQPAVLDASYLTTDTANAERFAEHARGQLVYVPELGWLYWDNRRWQRDVGNITAMRLTGETARNIYGEAQRARDDELAKRLARWADRSLSRQKRDAMLALAVGEPGIAATVGRLDTDPWLYNCLNGTVDLRTGELLRHDPEHQITKLVPVVYDPAATCALWLDFLNTVLSGSTALVQYVQRIVGYSLTGLTVEQVLFLLYGVGANGKSTFLETVRQMMGDYAQQADASAFLAKRSDGPNNDIARLHGARFVSAIEVGEGRRLAEALVKQMTGGDAVAARFLHREFFEFRPSFKLWLAANHKPIVRGTDHAIWRRIRLIPFTVTIPEGQRDKGLSEKLRGELPGILAWAVRGCLDWQRDGLQTPEAVSGATNEYRAEMDTLADFLAECCELGTDRTATPQELYSAYSAWCEQAGERAESKRWLGTRLKERGLEQVRGNKGRSWRGVAVASQQHDA